MSHNPLFPLFLIFVLCMYIASHLPKRKRSKKYATDTALPVRQSAKRVPIVAPVAERYHYPATLNTQIVYDESYVDITQTHFRVIVPRSERLFDAVKFTAQGRGFCSLTNLLLDTRQDRTIAECIKALTLRGATVQAIEMSPSATINGKRSYNCNVRFFHPPGCKLVRVSKKK